MFGSLRALPLGMYGAVMGLAGLGLAARSASPILPVKSPLPEVPIAIALLAFAVLLPFYLAKLLRHPDAVKEEFSNPATLGFCATLPVGLTLLAAGVYPYSLELAQAFWWVGAPMLIAMQLWGVARLLRGGIELAQVNGGWLIVFVGGIVTPFAGLPLGHAQLCTFMFGFSAVIAPFVLAAIFYRAAFGPSKPDGLRPAWFIVLVPPTLVYNNGAELAGHANLFLEFLFYFSLPLAAALIVNARAFLRWPFGAPWWAFTFPLDALAGAAARFAKDHPGGPWTAFAAVTLLLATGAVLLVLVRTLMALAQRGAQRA